MARKLRITHWKGRKSERRTAGVHSSSKIIFPENRFTHSLSPLSPPSSFTSNFEKSLFEFSDYYSRGRVWLIQTSNLEERIGRFLLFSRYHGVPAACSSRQSGRAVAVPLIQFLGLIKRRLDLVKLVRAVESRVSVWCYTPRSGRATDPLSGWG